VVSTSLWLYSNSDVSIRVSSVMGELIKFPSRKEVTKREEIEGLRLELKYCEENLKDYMEQLDFINEQILLLSKEYDKLVNKLSDLEGETDEKV